MTHVAPRRHYAIVVANVTVLAALLLGGGTPARGSAVPNSVRQVFRPGTVGNPISTAVTDYAGELLELQATKVGVTASEPTIGVGPGGDAYFAASTLQVDTTQAWGVAETKVMRSTDGGLTWENVQLRIPGIEESIPPANLDPFVWVDPTTGRIFNIDLTGACSWLNYSDDKGATWIPNPIACGTYVNDHQTVGAAPPRARETAGYPNAVYYCVNQLTRAGCGRSLDGGLLWEETAGDPYPPGSTDDCGYLHGHLETDHEGRLFLPRGCPWPDLAISEDDGDTWQRVRVTTAVNAVLPHTSVAADSAGNLYYLTMSTVQVGGRERVRPFLSISRDHGQTWGEPIMVAPPGVNYVNFPVIAAGDEGRIAINFPGSTSSISAGINAVWNQYMVVSENALSADPIFLSATANDPADPIHRGDCRGRCHGMWDFLDVVVSGQGQAWATASDDCLDECVTSKSTQRPHVGDGVAIRQIGGPALRVPAPQ